MSNETTVGLILLMTGLQILAIRGLVVPLVAKIPHHLLQRPPAHRGFAGFAKSVFWVTLIGAAHLLATAISFAFVLPLAGGFRSSRASGVYLGAFELKLGAYRWLERVPFDLLVLLLIIGIIFGYRRGYLHGAIVVLYSFPVCEFLIFLLDQPIISVALMVVIILFGVAVSDLFLLVIQSFLIAFGSPEKQRSPPLSAAEPTTPKSETQNGSEAQPVISQKPG